MRPALRPLTAAATALALLAPSVSAQNCSTADIFEPNDNCGEALYLPPGSSSFTGLNVELGDEDHYEYFVDAGEVLTVDVSFLHADADVDLQLSDSPCGTVVASSASTSDMESVAYTNTGAVGTIVSVRVFVYAFSAGSCAPYDLDATIVSNPCGADDTLAGTTPGSGAAFDLLSGLNLHEGLLATSGQSDYFRIQGTLGDNVGIRLDFEHADGDIDFNVYEFDTFTGQLSSVIGGSYGVGNSEEYSGQFSNSGIELVLEVYRIGGGTGCNRYDLAVMGGRYGDDRTICQGSFIAPWGLPAELEVTGSRVVADNDVTLNVYGAAPGAFGIFINSRGVGEVTPPGSGGRLCINDGQIGRFSRSGEIVLLDASGNGSLQLDVNQIPRPSGRVSLLPGDRYSFQFWFREGAGSSNFSNATLTWFE